MVLIQRELGFGQSTGVRQEGRSTGHETRRRGFGAEWEAALASLLRYKRQSCRHFLCVQSLEAAEWRGNC